jgi:hypothetical protein
MPTATEPTAASGPPVPVDQVMVSKADIRRALSSPLIAPTAAQEVGAALQLAPDQLSALMGGSADLHLSQSQYQSLVLSVNSLRKAASKDDKNAKPDDGAGSLCGSSASPAPAATPSPKVASVTTTKTDVTESAAGTTGKTEKVGVGTVTVRSDVKGDIGGTTYDHLFAISYKGSDSKDVHWLQFIHREIIGIHDDGPHAQTGNITTSGGTYALTPGGDATKNGTPAKGNYNTDTAASEPFYEAGFAANRTADATTMYDLPSAADARVQAAFAAGAKRVISRCHFDTFMINTDHVAYKVNVDIVYDFASSTAKPAPVTTVGGGAASGLPATIAQRFHEQFPAYNYIK